MSSNNFYFEKYLLAIFVGISQSLISLILPNIFLKDQQQQLIVVIIHLIKYFCLICGNCLVIPFLFNKSKLQTLIFNYFIKQEQLSINKKLI
uniref:Uncharacterized protein n=1 Tax=Meloidogyne enterolobii TaxID=390850 RepID=A0A6V7VNQ3_MELEN|nr:unnamed protein product [Meloidogyne enterolobii]